MLCVQGILKKRFGPSRKEDGLSNRYILYSMFLFCQIEEWMNVMSLFIFYVPILPNRGMDERDVFAA